MRPLTRGYVLLSPTLQRKNIRSNLQHALGEILEAHDFVVVKNTEIKALAAII